MVDPEHKSSSYPQRGQRPARCISPLDHLDDERLGHALSLLRLIRYGAVLVFFGGPAVELAHDLDRAGLIDLATEFDPEIGFYWRVRSGGPRR